MNKIISIAIGLNVLLLLLCNSSMAAARPDLSVKMEVAPNPVSLESLFTSTVTVSNAGPARAKKLKLIAQLPTNTVLQSNSDGCKFLTKRDRRKLLLTCKAKRLDPGQEIKWIVLLSAKEIGNSSMTASASSLRRDYNPDNNSASIEVIVHESDACGCPANTLWHPEMNHCMAIGLCDLPEYKGQCQTGDQCIACSKNGIPQRPKPGGVCP